MREMDEKRGERLLFESLKDRRLNLESYSTTDESLYTVQDDDITIDVIMTSLMTSPNATTGSFYSRHLTQSGCLTSYPRT